jgi:hypothetical protein
VRYSLTELLDQLHRDGAVALYLSQGFAPVFAVPSRPYSAELPSVSLFPVGGPILTREDLTGIIQIMRDMGYYVGTSGYVGICELRYRSGTGDLDVFIFTSEETTRIEFRQPGRYETRS